MVFLVIWALSKLIVLSFCVNKSVIYLAKDEKFHERTKHIDVQNFFIRLHVKNKVLYVMKIGTKATQLIC
jgi:hypothetical protein